MSAWARFCNLSKGTYFMLVPQHVQLNSWANLSFFEPMTTSRKRRVQNVPFCLFVCLFVYCYFRHRVLRSLYPSAVACELQYQGYSERVRGFLTIVEDEGWPLFTLNGGLGSMSLCIVGSFPTGIIVSSHIYSLLGYLLHRCTSQDIPFGLAAVPRTRP